jgi:hypothetical protein
MNIPRSRPLIRYTNQRKIKGRRPRNPDGHYISGLHNPEIAELVGAIVATLPQIEERMIEIMALLLGGGNTPARQVFRTLVSEDARVKVMRALLEHSPINKDKGQEFDDIIDLFVEVKKRRNAYAHGLWSTHDSGRTFLAEPSPDDLRPFLNQCEVKSKELNHALQRMSDLFSKSLPILFPNEYGKDGKLLPSLETPPPPPSKAGH